MYLQKLWSKYDYKIGHYFYFLKKFFRSQEMDDISNRSHDFTDGGRRSRRKSAVPKKVEVSTVESSPAKSSDSSLIDSLCKEDDISHCTPSIPQKSKSGKEDKKTAHNEVINTEVTEQPFKLLCYRFDHKRRGVCLIISNSSFDPCTEMPFRLGADVDLKNTCDAFNYLGFECVICCEFTRKELKEKAIELSRQDHSDTDCFACVVLTHGEANGQLYGRDGLYLASDLLDLFKGDRCLTLTGKPKLFFIQACRGSKLDAGTAVSVNQTDGCEKADRSQRIPLEADFLVAYSVVEGFYSWRNSVAGSWYIQALTKILRLHGTKIDLLTLLTRVNYVVAYEFESNASVAVMSKKKQIPCVQSMLTKQMYFIPK